MRIVLLLLVVAIGRLFAQKGIPLPNEVQVAQTPLSLTRGVSLQCMDGAEWQLAERLLLDGLAQRKISVTKSRDRLPGKVHINMMIDLDPKAHPESYRIKMHHDWMNQYPDGLVMMAAKKPVGLYYAVRTFLDNLDQGAYALDEVRDQPRFGYRGMHLDVSRHFFPVSFIKQYLDLMAECKMNTFHWHLTDDQGWRIEIKRYPKLQEVAAWRSETLIGHYNDVPHQFDGKRYGGYYTQEEIKEVVAYAAERFITVIPEIELPGHAVAALSAYPELSCRGMQPDRYPNTQPGNDQPGGAPIWGVFDDVYCTKDESMVFLENVLDEVISLFPGKYVHIGGDECPKLRWKSCPNCQTRIREYQLKDEDELQSWVIRRMEKYLSSKGKRLIGWDEILEGGLAPGATVMSWRGTQGGINAAKAGHDVIMTPNSHCYLDYYQSDAPSEPLAIGGLLPLEKVYAYEPIPTELNSEEGKHILGVQGNVWTEYMPTTDQVLYMALPRMQAIAEVGWTMPSAKNLSSFTTRLQTLMERWDRAGIHYANKIHDIRAKVISGDGHGVRVALTTLAGSSPISYTYNSDSKPYQNEPVLLTHAGTLTAKSEKSSYLKEIKYVPHKAAGAKVFLHHLPEPKYGGSGIGSPFNGINGSDKRYGDDEWLGFRGKDFHADVTFADTVQVSELTARLFHAPGQWIYASPLIEVITHTGNKTIKLGSIVPSPGESRVIEVKVPLEPMRVRQLTIIIKQFGKIPEGEQGAGHDAWLFVDELRLE